MFVCTCTFLLTISNLSHYLIFAKVCLTVRHGCSIDSVCRSHVPDVVLLSSLDRYAISLLTSNLAFLFSCWWLLLDGYHFPLEIATYLVLPVSSPFELFLSIALSPPSIILGSIDFMAGLRVLFLSDTDPLSHVCILYDQISFQRRTYGETQITTMWPSM